MSKIVGKKPPTIKTPGILGQEYVDSTSGALYRCVKVNHVTGPITGEMDAEYIWTPNSPAYEADEVVTEPLNITWDGNIDGLVSVSDFLFKVSDMVFTDEQIKLMSVTMPGEEPFCLGSFWDAGHVLTTEDITFTQAITVVRKDGAVLAESAALASTASEPMQVVFPEKGTYFLKMADNQYISALTSPELFESTKRVIHKLDEKYLPDNVARTSDVDALRDGIPMTLVFDDFSVNTLTQSTQPEFYLNGCTYDDVLYAAKHKQIILCDPEQKYTVVPKEITVDVNGSIFINIVFTKAGTLHTVALCLQKNGTYFFRNNWYSVDMTYNQA